ncbi:MAG TPA: helix-turn-helix domain-containing protein [Dehalococcoidia bacterium]|nr:helix-turn-helix domain-containing protein [Dehalococcoidia bacterium]
MHDVELGRLLRMLRLRRGWRQLDVAARAKVSTASVGRAELGRLPAAGLLRRHAAALDLRLEWRAIGRGAEVARLVDEEHAAIVELLLRSLRETEWQAEPEVSYSRYGERGRYDIFAFHSRSGSLAVVEVKTELADLQELLGRLDEKARLAGTIARQRGWRAVRILTVLAVAATAGNRAAVRAHRSTFDSFNSVDHRSMRRLALMAEASRGPEKLLLWVPARAASRDRWLGGRRRVRKPQHPC